MDYNEVKAILEAVNFIAEKIDSVEETLIDMKENGVLVHSDSAETTPVEDSGK